MKTKSPDEVIFIPKEKIDWSIKMIPVVGRRLSDSCSLKKENIKENFHVLKIPTLTCQDKSLATLDKKYGTI